MRSIKAIGLLLFVCLCVFAQGTTSPDFFVATGAGVTPQAVSAPTGWVNFAAKMRGNTYSYNTVDMSATKSTLRTGFAQMLKDSGRYKLLALVDAGVAAGDTVALGSYSAGFVFAYEVRPGVHAVFVQRIMHINSVDNTVQPAFMFGVGKSF